MPSVEYISSATGYLHTGYSTSCLSCEGRNRCTGSVSLAVVSYSEYIIKSISIGNAPPRHVVDFRLAFFWMEELGVETVDYLSTFPKIGESGATAKERTSQDLPISKSSMLQLITKMTNFRASCYNRKLKSISQLPKPL